MILEWLHDRFCKQKFTCQPYEFNRIGTYEERQEAINKINKISEEFDKKKELQEELLREMKDAVYKEENERNLRKHYHPKSFVVCWFNDDSRSTEIELSKDKYADAVIELYSDKSDFVILGDIVVRKSQIRYIQYFNYAEYYTCYEKHEEKVDEPV